MSEPEAEVRLQIFVAERLRARLKARAAEERLDMGELGGLILEHVLSQMAAGKTPPALEKAIEQFRKAKRQAEAEADSQ